MPNIAKIVCGTRGSVGAFGAINPSIIFTLISGRPNTELTLTIDYYTPSMPPQDKKLIAPENDAALCNTLCAVSALEPDENESDAYYSEIMLDDGSSYRVSYPQLNMLISALWRSCSGCGLSSVVCGTRGGIGFGGAIKTSSRITLTPGSPNAELTLTMGNYSQFMPPQEMKLTVPENDAALCNTLCAVSALEPDENESDAYYSEIMLDDGKSYRVRYSQLNVLISALWRSCSGCGFSSAPAPAQPAPQPPAGSWKCPACESQGQTGKYCTVCGTEKPQANSDG